MALTLKPEHERMVNEQLQTGHYRSAEEVIGCALEALRGKEQGIFQQAKKRDPKRAAARIRDRRRGVTLGGFRIKDLVNEGRR
jgi:Arc/MetJ-type ribon-helix-helix transcriptional regulator